VTRREVNPRYETCPYRDAPPTNLWAEAVANVADDRINPHLPPRTRLTPDARVATAGSCFAQHISRALVRAGFRFLTVETAPDWFTEDDRSRYGYEVFSARYGNIYTALQLVQLLDRAFGAFDPHDTVWQAPDGRWYDLLRPRIQPRGFASRAELCTDLGHHLAAVRRLFESLDVFVFTLGLTEAWRARADGTVFPTCPGCGCGEFDPKRYYFQNFTAAEVTAHLDEFLTRLRAVNPSGRVIFTVSPVPLAATHTDRHVLQATVYSKSVLRVAAEETVRRWPNADYFASFEIITATFRTHEYYGPNRRDVSQAGVDRAVAVFFEQFVEGTPAAVPPVSDQGSHGRPPAAEVVCDEAAVFEAMAERRAA
jgi:hypothetical protein